MTYNHEEYISQAIESAIMQNTNFNLEIVIGEDYSKDNTRKICETYKNEYPNLINLLDSPRNYGMVPNFIRTFKNCRGRYIALLEGDDYWLDPLKLQKQYEHFLINKSVKLCCHNALVYNTLSNETKLSLFIKNRSFDKIPFEIIAKEWIIPTASIVFDKTYFKIPDWFNNIINWDWALQILLAAKGDVKYIDEMMSFYRQHKGGNSNNPIYTGINSLVTQTELLNYLINELPNYKQIILSSIKSKETILHRMKLKHRNRFLYYLRYPIKTLNTFVNNLKN